MVKKGLSLIASSILEERMGFDIAPTYNNPSDIYIKMLINDTIYLRR